MKENSNSKLTSEKIRSAAENGRRKKRRSYRVSKFQELILGLALGSKYEG